MKKKYNRISFIQYYLVFGVLLFLNCSSNTNPWTSDCRRKCQSEKPICNLVVYPSVNNSAINSIGICEAAYLYCDSNCGSGSSGGGSKNSTSRNSSSSGSNSRGGSGSSSSGGGGGSGGGSGGGGGGTIGFD